MGENVPALKGLDKKAQGKLCAALGTMTQTVFTLKGLDKKEFTPYRNPWRGFISISYFRQKTETDFWFRELFKYIECERLH